MLLAGSGLLLLLRAYLPGAPAARLLADNRGLIELAVVSVSSARSSTLRNAELVSGIVNRLPEHTEILIMAPDRDAFSVLSNPWPERIRFVDMPADYRLTIWPQDPFVVLRDGDQTRLLAAPEFARADDREMASTLSAALGLPLSYTEFDFEGGNIVADDERVFIGADTIRYNALERDLDEEEVARRFQHQFGKAVIVVGPTPQPIGHIDMMLTPLGGKRLVLADPGWGARLARADLERAPDKVEAFERDAQRNFFGLPEIEELKTPDGERIRAPELDGSSRFAIDESEAIAAAVDRVGERLRELGFEIHRVPFLYRQPQPPQAAAAGETVAAAPGYPQLTYNNVLLETTADDRIVYLPVYGWDSLDDAAQAAWRELGYRVVSIPGFTTSAMYGGALRCSVKVLRRSAL